MIEQGPGGGERVRPTGPDRRGAEVRLDDVPCPAEDEGPLDVGHDQQRLEPPEEAVGAPVLPQLHAGPGEVGLVLLELRLEALEEGEGVGGAPGEASEDAAVTEPAHLSCGG